MNDDRRLRVLIVHNAYQLRGGEDSVVEAEAALLRSRGHEVELLIRHNDDVTRMSRVDVAAHTLWSQLTVQQMRGLFDSFKPDVVHVHNTLPLVSPSVFWAATQAGVPIVQTLHNFRLLCPQATFLRDGLVCEDCLGHAPWPAVVHRCYRNSLLQTGAVTMMLMLHRGMGTYRNKVTRYIALNEFCRSKFIEGGLPADRIDVKPNFVDHAVAPQWGARGGGLYVGRLSVEKGLETLLQAMRLHPGHQIEVIGNGPFEHEVQASIGAAYLGGRPLASILDKLANAAFLVLPSVCYEGFPRTLVEAFACGVPVIASRHGSLQELVDDGRTGLHFQPGDAVDLVSKIKWAQDHPEAMIDMGKAARAEYESRYVPERNCEELLAIYRQAMTDVIVAKG
jgi:glycosyltransferase involved in cell wall biosynthesis